MSDARKIGSTLRHLGFWSPTKSLCCSFLTSFVSDLIGMKNISIIGSGTMGNGIAHVFAQHGYHVALIDIEPKALEQALQTIAKNLDRQISKGLVSERQKSETLNRIQLFSNLAEGVSTADLVVEAATEDEKLKLALFRELDIHSP